MAKIDVSFSVEGVEVVRSMFEAAGRRAGNLRNAFTNISRYYRIEIDKNYVTQGALWGRWARRTRPYPWKLLYRSGKMASSFRYDVGSSSLVISNPTDYFKYHQSSKPRRSALPRRIMMDVQEEQRQMVVKILQKHVMES